MAASDAYTVFAIHSVFPVTDWHAVYWDTETGTHYGTPLFLLALANRRVRDRATQKLRRTRTCPPDDELRVLVGVEYALHAGLSVVNDHEHYCGLLPPNKALENYDRLCPHHAMVE